MQAAEREAAAAAAIEAAEAQRVQAAEREAAAAAAIEAAEAQRVQAAEREAAAATAVAAAAPRMAAAVWFEEAAVSAVATQEAAMAAVATQEAAVSAAPMQEAAVSSVATQEAAVSAVATQEAAVSAVATQEAVVAAVVSVAAEVAAPVTVPSASRAKRMAVAEEETAAGSEAPPAPPELTNQDRSHRSHRATATGKGNQGVGRDGGWRRCGLFLALLVVASLPKVVSHLVDEGCARGVTEGLGMGLALLGGEIPAGGSWIPATSHVPPSHLNEDQGSRFGRLLGISIPIFTSREDSAIPNPRGRGGRERGKPAATLPVAPSDASICSVLWHTLPTVQLVASVVLQVRLG